MAAIDPLLIHMKENDGSDLHLVAGQPPRFRAKGAVRIMEGQPVLSNDDLRAMMLEVASARAWEEYETTGDLDFAFGLDGVARFRANYFVQESGAACVFRIIPEEILSLDTLGMPKAICDLAHLPQGLVLVTGPTGSGKSTTLAAMIEHINANRTSHIMTIEDPIEFLVRDRRSIVNQREIGVDTHTFSAALRAALRQDPDVILVGEMRDFETIETALTAAETGHLVMSTLHTLDATETINRIISVFPPYQQKQVRLQLSTILKAVISQRLVPRADGKGRVPALEVLVSTAFTRELIGDKDRTKELPDAIAKGHTTYGMQTFDQSLMSHVKSGLVSYDEALKHVSNPDDFALRFRGIASTSDSEWSDFTEDESAEEQKPENDGVDGLLDEDDFNIDRF